MKIQIITSRKKNTFNKLSTSDHVKMFISQMKATKDAIRKLNDIMLHEMTNYRRITYFGARKNGTGSLAKVG